MRYLKSLLIMAAASVLAISCNKEKDPEVVKPEAPVIENASLKGLNGESVVIVGSKVRFSADITVEGSKLSVLSLEIGKGTEILASSDFTLEGTASHVEKEFDLPISAIQLDAPFYPEVKMKAVNTDEMFTEKKLTKEENVQISTPELFDALYLIDNNGKCWQMSPTSVKGNYRTDGDISEIGTSFTVASKITEDGKVDISGKTWTFDTPDSGEYGLRWIGFDQFSEEISKMIDNTIIVDFSKMARDGEHYVYWSFALVQDSRVVFLNFPDGALLQSDRFADVEKNTARYTGHTVHTDPEHQFEIYYIADTKWIIVKENYKCTDALWVTGENVSLPMSPYCEKHPIFWFEGTNPGKESSLSFDAASCVKTGEGKFKTMLYLKENFALKVYSMRSWGAELDWTSTTPETLIISERKADPETGKIDGNYGNAGASFTEGLYVLNYDKSTKNVSLEKYTGVVLAGMETGNADPDPSPTPDPEPDPDPDPDPEVPDSGNTVTVDKSAMAAYGDRLAIWSLKLKTGDIVNFTNFDAKVSEMLNLAVFSEVDDEKNTAKYTGAEQDYEVYYLPTQKWLLLTLNYLQTDRYILIGKNCSFPQSPYTDYPLIDSDIQPTKGQALPLNKVSEGIFRSYIYLADDFAFHLYSGTSWDDCTKGWTSGSPNYLVAKEEDNLYYGVQDVTRTFTPGIYLVEYDKNNNKISLSPKK